MIDKLIKKYSNDLNYRYQKVMDRKTTEEDIILLLRDLSEIVSIITRLRDDLTKKLQKYMTKN